MNDLSDRTAYLAADRTRLEVALACRGAPATRTQIAKELGRDPGGLSAMSTLEARGVLRAEGTGPASGRRRGGKQWVLNPCWEEAADLAAHQVRKGILSDGLDLILIRATDLQEACRLLSSADVDVSWGVPLKGEQMGLLICPSYEPNEAKAIELLALLGKHVQPIRLHLPAIMSEVELKEWAREITGEPSPLAVQSSN